MPTTPTTQIAENTTTDAPDSRRTHGRFAARRGILTWAGIAAAIAATIGLSVATFTGADNSAEELEQRAQLEDSAAGSDQHLINRAEELEQQTRNGTGHC